MTPNARKAIQIKAIFFLLSDLKKTEIAAISSDKVVINLEMAQVLKLIEDSGFHTISLLYRVFKNLLSLQFNCLQQSFCRPLEIAIKRSRFGSEISMQRFGAYLYCISSRDVRRSPPGTTSCCLHF